MANYDVFNGDTDGIFAWHQLRLVHPRDATIVTGVKRYVGLVSRVNAGDGDLVTVMDVSHAKNRTKRTFQPNLHKHKFWVESENRYVSLTVSANGMRTIDKNGIDKVLADIRARGEKI